MKLDEKIAKRLQDLLEAGEEVKRTVHARSGVEAIEFGQYGVDHELAQQWGTSTLNLLAKVFGVNSVHYEQYETQLPMFYDYRRVVLALSVLKAAIDDYKNEFLFDTRTLIEAEVFDDFLD